MNLKSTMKFTVFISSFFALILILILYCFLGLELQKAIRDILSKTYDAFILYDIFMFLYRNLYLVFSLIFSGFVYKYLYKSKLIFISSNTVYIILSSLLCYFVMFHTRLFNSVLIYEMLKLGLATGLYNIIFFVAFGFLKNTVTSS